MDTRTKKIIVGCAIALVFALVVAVIAGVRMWRMFNSINYSREMPPALETARVVKEADLLSKAEFWRGSGVGQVTDIVEDGSSIVLVGGDGAVFVDQQAATLSSVSFASLSANSFPGMSHVDAIDVEGDGVYDFMDRGSWGNPASLIDSNGATVWSYGAGSPGVDDMAAGDIDGDGELEFVVGFNGGGGVHLVETDGRQVWRQDDGNVWHVEMVDTDGDGQLEILHSNAGGEMKVRDARGAVLNQSRPPAYFSGFSLCNWPGKGDPQHALLSESGTIWVLGFDGKSVAKLDAPDCGDLGHARAVPVKLDADEDEYFAVLVAFRNRERSILYLYDHDENLVYQEVLAEACECLAAVSSGDPSTERLLIGGDQRVWQYTLAATCQRPELSGHTRTRVVRSMR